MLYLLKKKTLCIIHSKFLFTTNYYLILICFNFKRLKIEFIKLMSFLGAKINKITTSIKYFLLTKIYNNYELWY
jgi:hypothetical protein